jgi:ParB-like chromosome segregation protein Spo0J
VKGYLIDHPDLVSENRKQIKIYRINPEKDIDINALKKIMNSIKKFY